MQPQATNQNTVILDDATSESDVDIAYFTPKTTSNAPSEPHDFSALSNGRLQRVQKQAHPADFIWVTSQCWNNNISSNVDWQLPSIIIYSNS